MDGFTYHDIFQTKGIEYIIIIAFLLMIIPFWMMINRSPEAARKTSKSPFRLSAEILNIPRGLFFSRNLTWAHLERSGLAKVGLSNLLMHITGEVKAIRLISPGETVTRGEPILELEQGGKKLRILSPVSGRLVDENPLLETDPGVLNEDPYGKGWIYRIEPVSWKEETRSFLLAEEAIRWSVKELERFRDFIARSLAMHSPEAVPVILQDGGELSESILSRMPAETWKDFQQEFLDADS